MNRDYTGQMGKKLRLPLSFFILISLLSGPIAHAESEPGITDTEILLGSSYSQTGPLSSSQTNFFKGAQAYFDYLNAQGGIYGRKIRISTFDDQNVVTKAVQGTNKLILQDQVFALFNSAAVLSASHTAAATSAGIAKRGIPDLFPFVGWSGFRDAKKYPTTFILSPSTQQEARVIANFVKEEFPNLRFIGIIQSDDIDIDVQAAWNPIGFTLTQTRRVVNGAYGQVIPALDEKTGAIQLTTRLVSGPERVKSSSPVIVLNNAFSSIQDFQPSSKENWANTYAGMYLPLPTETDDEFIVFFNRIFALYLPGQSIDVRTIEGANAAYVLSQALAGVGPELTRAKLIDFLRTKGSTLSHAGYAPLNFGSGSGANKTSIYFAKFDGKNWNRYSDTYQTDVNSNLVTKVVPVRSKLLPNGLPLFIKGIGTQKKTITCMKGKKSIVVTASEPVCPVGYKKR